MNNDDFDNEFDIEYGFYYGFLLFDRKSIIEIVNLRLIVMRKMHITKRRIKNEESKVLNNNG